MIKAIFDYNHDYNYQAFQAPIRIYSSYRFLLSVIFLGMAAHDQVELFTARLTPALTISLVYSILATGFFLGAMRQTLPVVRHTFIGFVVDIFFIALLEYTSVRENITLDLILVVAVAAGSIVFSGRLGTAIAALATIFLCLKAFALDTIFGKTAPDNLRTALLGITFFATSWITQTLSKRLKESELVASEQANAIVELQKLNQAIVERMHTGVTVFTGDIELEMMNDAAKRLLSEETSQELDPRQGLEKVQKSIRHWLQNSEQRISIQINEQAPELKLGFTFLGDENKIVVFLEDSSKVKQHAQQLKLASLGRLAASIAHEIRNPLAAVSYSTQLLQETDLSQEQRHLSDILKKHTQRVNDIVNNVLQISSRKPPDLRVIQFSEWFEHFLSSSLQREQLAKISTDLPNTLLVDFDPSHLGQVMTNIVENALNAAEEAPSGVPMVQISAGWNTNLNRPYIIITDSGPGIAKHAQPHIFEPFFTTSKTGSGLGLFLCREICELNHARINVIPSEAGTCFQILFKPRTPNE